MSQTKRTTEASSPSKVETPINPVAQREPVSARFSVGVQSKGGVTTGINAKNDKAKLSLTQFGLLIEQEGRSVLVPYSNITQVILA